jgi:hypothetical protein
MKGGSAALILLDTLLFGAKSDAHRQPASLLAHIDQYRQCVERTHQRHDVLRGAMRAVGRAVAPPRAARVVFVAESSRVAPSAVLAVSEMTDTFGFERNRLRAVVADRESDVPAALHVDPNKVRTTVRLVRAFFPFFFRMRVVVFSGLVPLPICKARWYDYGNVNA